MISITNREIGGILSAAPNSLEIRAIPNSWGAIGASGALAATEGATDGREDDDATTCEKWRPIQPERNSDGEGAARLPAECPANRSRLGFARSIAFFRQPAGTIIEREELTRLPMIGWDDDHPRIFLTIALFDTLLFGCA